METKFFTNKEENTLIKKFEGIFAENQSIKYFDALVGYFRASGYFNIRPFLEKIPKIRILVGINVDKLVTKAQNAGLDFFKNDEATKEEFIQKTQEDIKKANYDKKTEEGILQFIDDIIEKKIEIRAHPEKKIHAKVYIFKPEPFTSNNTGMVITGSSNLTDPGLGTGNNYNYEFNVQLNDYVEVAFAAKEFEELWKESVEILPVDLQKVKENSYLNEEITPFELYIKLLLEYFGDSIDYDPESFEDLPLNFKKLSYQLDAVNEGFNMLLKHNGFILADVVGLGKTVIATMVAKKFLLKNGKSNTKILVVYPPAIEENWKKTFKYFQIDKYTKFVSNGSLHHVLENKSDYWSKEEYDLVIVDEAHKFRTNTTKVFQYLQRICKSRRTTKGYIEGSQKKIILVSATPLNNKPDDIYYLIQLFQDARQSTLPITDLTSFFGPLIEEYKKLKRFDELDINKLRNIYGRIRKNVIEPITVRRTRTDLENIEEYKTDLIEQGIIFPKVTPPKKVEYTMDKNLNELFYKTVEFLTKQDESSITYARYQAIAFLKPEIQIKYYENAETASKSLAFIMKTQLVKRLESSFFAFKKSLKNFKNATERMITMFENNKIFIAPDSDINKLFDKGWSEEEIEREIERLSENNPKNQTFKADDFLPQFLNDLKKDVECLRYLVNEWDKINDDPKLNVFLEELNNQFLKKDTNLEGKLVIFTESKETAAYLHEKLLEKGRKDTLTISAENHKNMYTTIANNFDANIEPSKKSNTYNILITTEVLAEGVNLHRANVIIHYDTPWNSTRLMQRIGRINRIGTKAESIYNYVFYPSDQGDSQIKLNKTAFMKIQAFHTAFGEDNQVYTEEEILDEITLFNKEAIKEEQDERLKYLFFLRNFRKNNKKWLDNIKKLPLKSRTGREASKTNSDLKNSTLAFLKTSKKFEFYLINQNNIPIEITPVEAFKIFESDKTESSCSLIENHHEQVNIALEDFKKIEIKQTELYTAPEAYGAIPKKAKKYLSEIIKYPQVTEKQKLNIQEIIKLIDIGKYTNLAGDIYKLQKKKTNLTDSLNEIDIITQNYDIEYSELNKKEKIQFEKPILIISESFK